MPSRRSCTSASFSCTLAAAPVSGGIARSHLLKADVGALPSLAAALRLAADMHRQVLAFLAFWRNVGGLWRRGPALLRLPALSFGLPGL
eukprot:5511610-Alexandrium_andersonii.AAC.1